MIKTDTIKKEKDLYMKKALLFITILCISFLWGAQNVKMYESIVLADQQDIDALLDNLNSSRYIEETDKIFDIWDMFIELKRIKLIYIANILKIHKNISF